MIGVERSSFNICLTLLFFCNLLPVWGQTDSVAISVGKELQEVNVVGWKKGNALQGAITGKLTLDFDKLGTLPRFLGHTDVVRTLQLLPGVQASGELNSGIYIRGGDPAHNNILLNGAPIYNAMHLMGFFSLFNGDHYSQATLQKSYISPEYGGRLSSVLEMSSHDEIADQFSIRGSVGLISSQATASIPTGDFGTIYLSGRTTYLRPFLKLFRSDDGMKMLYDFADVNLSYTAAPVDGGKLLINGYFGNDHADMEEYQYQIAGKIKWNNGAASAQWQQTLSDGCRLDATAYFSWYRNHISIDQNNVHIIFPSEIRDTGARLKFSMPVGASYLTIGTDYAFHYVDPQVPDAMEMFGNTRRQDHQIYNTHEIGIYANLRTPWNEHLLTDIGLRYSNLLHTGAYTDRLHDEIGTTIAETDLGKGIHKYYGNAEPRIGITWIPRHDSRIRASYIATAQYMNQVMTSGLGFPTDFWVPASRNIKPQRAHAVNVGYFRTFGNGDFEASVEGYYRKMYNLLEYDGELFDMVNRRYDAESGLISGNGEAYGIELMLQKNGGRLSGWISYTLGWNNRQFPGIENGRRFPAKFDRRHDLSIAANYRINDKWDIGATFVYATGCAFTMPDRFYIVGENLINHYGAHNGARMPAYHRLDLSANLWLRRSRKTESGINFSVYNAYARNNPIFMTIKMEPNEEKTKISIRHRSISLFNIIPSIGYFFKF